MACSFKSTSLESLAKFEMLLDYVKHLPVPPLSQFPPKLLSPSHPFLCQPLDHHYHIATVWSCAILNNTVAEESACSSSFSPWGMIFWCDVSHCNLSSCTAPPPPLLLNRIIIHISSSFASNLLCFNRLKLSQRHTTFTKSVDEGKNPPELLLPHSPDSAASAGKP